MKEKYSDEYVERTVKHYERMTEEIHSLRIERDISRCQIARLETKLSSLGVDPTDWQSFPAPLR